MDPLEAAGFDDLVEALTKNSKIANWFETSTLGRAIIMTLAIFMMAMMCGLPLLINWLFGWNPLGL